jgi:hypothetical protein
MRGNAVSDGGVNFSVPGPQRCRTRRTVWVARFPDPGGECSAAFAFSSKCVGVQRVMREAFARLVGHIACSRVARRRGGVGLTGGRRGRAGREWFRSMREREGTSRASWAEAGAFRPGGGGRRCGGDADDRRDAAGRGARRAPLLFP